MSRGRHCPDVAVESCSRSSTEQMRTERSATWTKGEMMICPRRPYDGKSPGWARGDCGLEWAEAREMYGSAPRPARPKKQQVRLQALFTPGTFGR